MNFPFDHLEVTAVAINAGYNLGSMGLEQCYPTRNGRVTPANKRREFDHFLDWHSGFSQASKNSDPLDVAMTVSPVTASRAIGDCETEPFIVSQCVGCEAGQ
jgi:hypothetical protein